MTTFHNTANLSGIELTEAQTRATKENETVLLVMAKIGHPCTSWEIYNYWVQNKVTSKISHSLLQNIRRSLNNLERLDKVINTQQRRKGDSGVSNYIWQLV